MRIVLIYATFLFSLSCMSAQQTVGLFTNNSKAFNGYTLFGNNEITYLIDNCGFKVHTWMSDYDPGLTSYILPNGNLLRTGRVSVSFSGGGLGGRIEILDWNSNVIWSYKYANNTVHAHHDIEPLPNGNILVLAWEKHTQTASKNNGRKYDGEVWSEKIIEIEPVGTNQANIVWEWRVWDHLIQDYNASKQNFGIVADHPELIDLNYIGEGEDTDGDWIHANAIAYNAELDQIALSSRNFSEIWLIDHSTSTAQAASHIGGNSNKGGDILYRYGNPKAYQRGDENDQVFFQQHDIRWIPEGLPYEGKLMVFNNIDSYKSSSVEIWSPSMDNLGNYVIEMGQPFGPNEPDWEYVEDDFYSEIMSGAEMLPNGNILICEGETGRFFEITQEKEKVWEYINPVNRNGGPTAQGGSVHFNEVFQVKRYSVDYEGLIGKSIEPSTPVEINPWNSDCEIFEMPLRVEKATTEHGISILGNPFSNFLTLKSSNSSVASQIEIFDVLGNSILRDNLHFGIHSFDTNEWKKGIYFIQIRDDWHLFSLGKVIKN